MFPSKKDALGPIPQLGSEGNLEKNRRSAPDPQEKANGGGITSAAGGGEGGKTPSVPGPSSEQPCSWACAAQAGRNGRVERLIVKVQRWNIPTSVGWAPSEGVGGL